MTLDEITDQLALDIDELWAEAEVELDRDLTDQERQSIADEFLAGLDDDEEDQEDA